MKKNKSKEIKRMRERENFIKRTIEERSKIKQQPTSSIEEQYAMKQREYMAYGMIFDIMVEMEEDFDRKELSFSVYSIILSKFVGYVMYIYLSMKDLLKRTVKKFF